MGRFLYENRRGSRTLTLLNVLGVLGVLNALHVLDVLYVLHMPMDASLACWALFKLDRSNIMASRMSGQFSALASQDSFSI